MRIGGERVTTALLRAPKISAVGLIRLLPLLLQNEQKKLTYQMYVSECLRIITENTAKLSGGEYIRQKYQDIVNPRHQETKSCEEITAEVVKKCGLVVKA